jgi:hypothetical protein
VLLGPELEEGNEVGRLDVAQILVTSLWGKQPLVPTLGEDRDPGLNLRVDVRYEMFRCASLDARRRWRIMAPGILYTPGRGKGAWDAG